MGTITTLPQLNTDLQYTTTLPISGKNVIFRPFFVKEEKILLMAMESDNDDPTETYEAIKNVLSNCTYGKLNINKLSILDVEWLMIQIRIRSKGEIVDLKMKCKAQRDNAIIPPTKDDICNHINEIPVDLTKVRLDTTDKEKNNPVINLTDKIGVKLRYPSFSMLDFLGAAIDKKPDIETSDEMLISCVESIYHGDIVYKSEDVEKKELIRFFDQMTEKQFSKIKDFFSTIPKVRVDVQFSCDKCGHKEELKLEGIRSFFG